MNGLAVLAMVSLGMFALVSCGDNHDESLAGSPNKEFGVIPAHQRELDRIPVYPGSARNATTASTGGGTFAEFCADSTSELVAVYYNEALARLGWQSTSALTALPSKDGSQQEAMVFVKDEFSLTIYLSSGCKGGQPGDLRILFRLQDRPARQSAISATMSRARPRCRMSSQWSGERS